MMKLIGLVGTNAPRSYNRLLLNFIRRRYEEAGKLSITVTETKSMPMFEEVSPNEIPSNVLRLGDRISEADGVIIATPEYDHSIPAVLKSVIEWLSALPERPLSHKPVMIVGTSLGSLGTARAQDHLRQILNAPCIEACVLPGCEFLLGHAADMINEEGDVTDCGTVEFLDECFANYRQFVFDHRLAERNAVRKSLDCIAR